VAPPRSAGRTSPGLPGPQERQEQLVRQQVRLDRLPGQLVARRVQLLVQALRQELQPEPERLARRQVQTVRVLRALRCQPLVILLGSYVLSNSVVRIQPITLWRLNPLHIFQLQLNLRPVQ
jgi:hypothetical protein